jgi:hypothetical protein
MAARKEDDRPEGYTTAEFRKGMAEVFEAARYRDAIIDVSHHGKPWVSVMSPQNADYIKKIRDIGEVEAGEVKAVVNSLKSPIRIHELFLRISDARRGKNT